MRPSLKKQRLFIYDRKEMTILSLLFIMIGIFTFTLGIHYGKRINTKTASFTKEGSLVRTVSDSTPSRQEILDHSKINQKAMEESLSQELHDEVTKTGIRLHALQTVDLPEMPKDKNGGATTLGGYRTISSQEREKTERKDGLVHFHREKYTLQIASFKSFDEGKERLSAMKNIVEPKPFLREVDLKSKGTWYRIYLGGFFSREEAQSAGQKYFSQHLIDSFVVTTLPD